MRVGWFTPLRPPHAEARDDVERLLPLIARDAEIGVLAHEAAGPGAAAAGIVVHDLRGVHYRKLLWRYDLVVYSLADDPAHDYLEDALREWPGLVLAYDDDLEPQFRRRPELRRAVLDASLLLAVGGPAHAARIRLASPFTRVAVLSHEGSIEDRARACRALFRDAIRARGQWLEPLLEAACAEIPGRIPGDRLAPWHSSLAELLSVGRASKPRE